MPLIDVIYPEGALTPKSQQELRDSLWSTALRWEGIERTAGAASVAWVYLDERPRRRIGVGGHEMTQNVYRINVRVMVGFMDQVRINGMAQELTDAILAADGGAGDGTGPRVFYILEEIESGSWSVDGKIWTSVFAAQTLGLSEQRIKAMDRAIKERPRVEVPQAVRA